MKTTTQKTLPPRIVAILRKAELATYRQGRKS
jgi:hypothetical protein